jgi:hypothetical protein
MYETTFLPREGSSLPGWVRRQSSLFDALGLADPATGVLKIGCRIRDVWTQLTLTHNATGWQMEAILGHHRMGRAIGQSREQTLAKLITMVGLDQPITIEMLWPIAKHWHMGLPHSEIASYYRDLEAVKARGRRIMADVNEHAEPAKQPVSA